MRFSEAMRLLEEGKRVRCITWNKEAFMVSKNGNLIFYYIDHRYCNSYSWNDWNKEWELYEEPVQLMSFMEILPGMKMGKSYKRRGWEENPQDTVSLRTYPYLNGRLRFENQHGQLISLFCDDIEATDWYEVE